MKRLRGLWVKWAVIGVGFLTTSCVGALGAGAAAVIVGAGIMTFTCYDRVSVTVTDGLTGTKLCDAKVTFVKGKSETPATSCYQAALSAGKYTMRVERRGLVTFEEPVEVSESGKCGQSVQSMYVALDRLNRPAAPVMIAAPAPAVAGTTVAPAAIAAPASPATSALPPPPPPPPASTAFPDTP